MSEKMKEAQEHLSRGLALLEREISATALIERTQAERINNLQCELDGWIERFDRLQKVHGEKMAELRLYQEMYARPGFAPDGATPGSSCGEPGNGTCCTSAGLSSERDGN
jgi:hypothetical protein